ncbi:MAG: hypothetical protein KI790_10280 [Cyclobacteriaceae bacterium]|nr:hypothetical protein [Cyclobacteriaceae bacterium HetDA_MAG_MS6]
MAKSGKESISNKSQVDQWLKKLEQESWQLELLVSAFTIFLLIQANMAYSDFLQGLRFQYDVSGSLFSFAYIFLSLIGASITALVFFLVIHLLLRGFWIGSIGLRSVQSRIDFEDLKYSEFFTKRLEKRVVSLDRLVVMLDEICSVIFSFSFLVISILISFGTYLIFLSIVAFLLDGLGIHLDGWLEEVYQVVAAAIMILVLLTGIVYLLDFFSLGFFKKYRRLSKLYYPIYKFYGWITLSAVSRSIYYYLISKFSKKKIRLGYLVGLAFFLYSVLIDFDQFQFYPHERNHNESTILSNHYDDKRSEDDFVERVSLKSEMVSGKYMPLFIRYESKDNELIQSQCEGFEPKKRDGFNFNLSIKFREGGITISSQKFEDEDIDRLLKCLTAIFQVSINDSVYSEPKYYFHKHPGKDQYGIYTMLSTNGFLTGENVLKVSKKVDEEDQEWEDYAFVPFWYDPD